MAFHSRLLCTAIAAISLFGSASAWAAQAQNAPKLEGTYREWFVYSSGTGADKVCYALAQPKATLPKGVNRNPIFFLISTWPSQKKVAEPSVVPGYPYKAETKVEVQIGSDKFAFFTKNDGNAGGAWMEKAADEKRLLDAMKRGQNMTVIGTSTRGTLTRDAYSLAGITAALNSVATACK